MLGFWPYWYEFGIDAYDHENKWQAANTRPENFGGALVTHLEIPYYGKDDIDPRERLREQGRMWARSHSQAFLRMQRERGYWKGVNTAGAVFLPVPETILLEDLTPVSGAPGVRRNAAGGPMRIYNEEYEHGVGKKAGDPVTYAVPEGTSTFRAMAAVDDAESGSGAVVFVVERDGREIRRSRPLVRGEREMIFVAVEAGKRLTLRLEGRAGMLGNWGGAKFTLNDPEVR
jgi:hypothetical protein